MSVKFIVVSEFLNNKSLVEMKSFTLIKIKNGLLVLLFGVFAFIGLCGCPESIQGDQGPVTIVKMYRDYSEYAYYYSSDSKGTLYRIHEGTIKHIEDFYYIIELSPIDCEKIVFISRFGKDIESGKTYMQSTDSVIDSNPFIEIYEYDEGNHDIKKIRNIIKSSDLGKFKRIK